MKRKLLLWVIGGVMMAFTSQNAKAQNIYGISDNSLILINTQTIGNAQGNPITGIPENLTLQSIDFRPATGELFGFAYEQSTGLGQLFSIDKSTAVATPVGSMPLMLAANMGEVYIDFNPTVDRIRLVSSNDNNYRLNPITGGLAATDGTIAYAMTDVNMGMNPEIITGAYTNSYIGSTSTVLYNYDAAANVFTSQVPPNNGTQNTLTNFLPGQAMEAGNGDLDFFYDSQNNSNIAYFAAKPMGQSFDRLYSVDVLGGSISDLGELNIDLSDIAVEISFAPLPIMGRLVYGLTSNSYLISFDSANPMSVYTHVAVSGLAMGQSLVGMDFRPANGMLYGLGYNSMNGEARIYTINTMNGAATAIGDAPIMLGMNLGKIGFDFNPAVDRIRVITSNNSNFRLHPDTGVLVSTDLPLNFAAADMNVGINPSIGAGAYSNSFMGTTATTLFNYDDSLNIFVSQVPPNDGTLNTIGSSGIMVNLMDPTSDLDIFYTQQGAMNTALFSANVGMSSFDNLYNVDLTTGAATLIGKIGNGIAVLDISATTIMLDLEAPMLTCVEDQMIEAEMMCMATLPDFTTLVMASDNSGDVPMLSQMPMPGMMISEETTVTITATDASGNVATCSFVVSISDMTPPSISCTVGAMVANPLGNATVFVSLPVPTVMDNCDGVMITNSFNSMEDASGFYPIGMTEVTFSAIDASGNTSFCTIMVNVASETTPEGDLIFGLSSDNMLVSFGSSNPSEILSSTPISGVTEGYMIAGMDSRPATGELYALAYNADMQMGQIGTIDLGTGLWTGIGTPVMLALGNESIGFDFNPTVDRIRVIGANNGNYRMHPVTGAIAATDLTLAFAAGDINANQDPAMGSGAYINSFNGATSTTLYDYDQVLNILATQVPPNDGILNTVGNSGIVVNSEDPSVDLDVFYDLETMENRAYLNANTMDSSDMLYMLDLSTGMAMEIDQIGSGLAILDIAAYIGEIAVGTEEVALELETFQVYPNPADQVLNISFKSNQTGVGSIVITDITGRAAYILNNLAIGQGSVLRSIDISELSAGIYTVNFSLNGNLVQSQKLTVK